MSEMKKKLSGKNKEINDFRKKINSVEAKLLDKKLERHAVLKKSKIELIDLPMLRGSMSDISDEDQLPSQTQKNNDETLASSNTNPAPSSSANHTQSLNTVSTNEQNYMFEKESHIKINYKKLETDFLNMEVAIDIEKTESKISSRIYELRELLNHFSAPNMKVDEK